MKEAYEALELTKLPYIHVAGTNGKGSCVQKISEVLTLSGYTCGRYSSPHLCTFRERIQIDGQMVTPEEVERYLPPLLERFSKLTFFEVVTLFAFFYFAEKKVDVAVIEVGLGGRLDATNCIDPLLSVITSIGLDHQHILGDTLEKIAYEKGGIIKENVPVLLGPSATQEALKKLALEKKAPYFLLEGSFASYDEENQAISQKALELIHSSFPVSPWALEKGLKAKPPCRQESLLFKAHEVVLDMSHNPQGMTYLFKSLKKLYPNRPITAFVSFSQGHDAQKLADLVQKECHFIYLLDLKHPKLFRPKELQQFFSSFEAILKATSAMQVLENAPKEPLYLFVGSLYMMQEVRSALGFQEVEDSFLILDGSFNFR